MKCRLCWETCSSMETLLAATLGSSGITILSAPLGEPCVDVSCADSRGNVWLFMIQHVSAQRKSIEKRWFLVVFFLTNINRHVHIYIYIYLYISFCLCSFCFHISWCECWPHKSCSHPWGLLFHRRNAMVYSCQWAKARFQASISGGMVMQGSNRSIKRCWEVLQVCLRLLLKISLLKTSTVCRSMSLHLII